MLLKLIKFDEETRMCELELDDEAKHFLLEQGFNALLKNVLEEMIANEQEKGRSL